MQFCFSSLEGSNKPSWDRRAAQQKGGITITVLYKSAVVSRGRVVAPAWTPLLHISLPGEARLSWFISYIFIPIPFLIFSFGFR